MSFFQSFTTHAGKIIQRVVQVRVELYRHDVGQSGNRLVLIFLIQHGFASYRTSAVSSGCGNLPATTALAKDIFGSFGNQVFSIRYAPNVIRIANAGNLTSFLRRNYNGQTACHCIPALKV